VAGRASFAAQHCWLFLENHSGVLADNHDLEQVASKITGSRLIDHGAHLAALAIEHGATLYTNDRDFARFPGLKVEYPLQ
jgi:predicted nucleic acid-binding protein